MSGNDTHADTIREALSERWRVRKNSMGHFESMLHDTTQALAALDALVAEVERERARADQAEAALICSPVRRTILIGVSGERDRQDEKWGGVPGLERRDDHTYAAVLGEEFGEACAAWLERDMRSLREELIQTAAVAIAWVEEIDNGGALPRSERNQQLQEALAAADVLADSYGRMVAKDGKFYAYTDARARTPR